MKGLFMVGLPESTLDLVKEISRKTNLSYVQIISEALAQYALKIAQKSPPPPPKTPQTIGQKRR